MPLSEEEKREKLLKLKYDSYKTQVPVFVGAFITFYVSAVILFSNEYARGHLFWLIPSIIAVIMFIFAWYVITKMDEYQNELEKMYTPKEDSQSEQKKRGKGERINRRDPR